MWFQVTMDVVLGAEKFKSTSHLLCEMPHNYFIEAAHGGVWVFLNHVLCLRVVDEVSPFLNKGRKVAELAEFHDNMHA